MIRNLVVALALGLSMGLVLPAEAQTGGAQKTQPRQTVVERLNLTPQQADQMKKIQKAARDQRAALRVDLAKTKDRDAKRAIRTKIAGVKEDQRKRLAAVLTPEQMRKLDAMRPVPPARKVEKPKSA